MTKRRSQSRVPEDVPAAKLPKTTAATVEARRATVEGQAAQGDWLAEYVSRCAKVLDVTFPDSPASRSGPPTPRSPAFLRRRG